MVTALLIVALVLVLAGIVAVTYQMGNNPFLLVLHVANGSLSLLGQLVVAIIKAIGEINS